MRSERAQAAYRRAQVAHELAERSFDPIEPLRAGTALDIAAQLYLQAAYWSLCTLNHDGEAVAPEEAWQNASEVLAWALPDDTMRAALHAPFSGNAFRTLAELDAPQQQLHAAAARTLSHALIERIEAPAQRVASLRVWRVLRVALVSVLLAVSFVLGNDYVHELRRGPDLLAGHPFRTSSVWATCDIAAERCGSLNTKIFFHTKEDPTPWIEYDLGKPTAFSELYVKNRSDDAPDRAVPLLVEVSNDARVFRQVARRDETFRTWETRFAPQNARYLRLRVSRRSYFHLERIMLFR